jgi:ABC-type transport system involved in multi-copper enzyme maturation permease subunit
MLAVFLAFGIFFGFGWGVYNLSIERVFDHPPVSLNEQIDPVTLQRLLSDYANRIEVLDQLIFQAELVHAPDNVKYSYVVERNELQFYLDTNTVSFQYERADNVFFPSSVIRGESFTFLALVVFRYLLYAYAIFLGASSIALEYRSGTIRSLVASPISRSNILIGKGLNMLAESAVAVIATGAIALLISSYYGFGLAPILVRQANSFTSVSVFALIAVRLVSIWIGMVFLIALSAAIGVLLRQLVAALLIPIGVYAVSVGIFAVLLTSDAIQYRRVDLERLSLGFPLLSLDMHLQAWNWDFTIMVLIHLFLAATFLFIAHEAFKQQNV